MGTTARRGPLPPYTYRRRRIAALVLLLLVVGLVVALCSRLASQPEPEPEESVESTVSDGPVAQSRPVEMEVPHIGLHAEFESVDCRIKDGAIDPATLNQACAYTAPDKPYELPGSDASDIVVVAGHASAGRPGVFDALYDVAGSANTVSLGDALYMRTQASGDRWLKYVATDLHEPTKDVLSQDVAVWGTEPMPGRLLTITCIQPLVAESVRNAVVGWQFDSVVNTPE